MSLGDLSPRLYQFSRLVSWLVCLQCKDYFSQTPFWPNPDQKEYTIMWMESCFVNEEHGLSYNINAS